MVASLREYLSEKGVRRDLAVELDEIALSMNHRMKRLQRNGVEKSHILIEVGKYRHMEQRSPKSLLELLRVVLDLALLTINFGERFRVLEGYGIIKFNLQTAEYEFTKFGKQFFEDRPVPS